MAALTIAQASCADDYDPNSMPVAKAREFIFRFLDPLQATIRVPIRSALGRVLAEDVISPVDVPSHRNSAMDGWAMRGDDLKADAETTLTEIGVAFAGKPFAGLFLPGQCVRIMTGGVVPDGADTVVMQERARADGKSITFSVGQKTGQNVREAGEDLKRGSAALTRGRRIRPAELGLIASLGIGEVTVYRPLRVAFFSTGDELKSVGSTLGEGEIYDSNRYTLHGMLTRLGCEVLDMGVVRDDPALIEAAFATAASSADVVITSGGVSVGEADFVKSMLAKLGEVVFWKIAMKPGRPLAYGKIGNAHFFGLPGNPVSVMVTFYQFVRDALLTLMGATNIEPVPTFPAVCSTRLKKAPGRTEFQRGILTRGTDGGWTVRPTGEQGSGILKSMSDANCFIILGDHVGNVEAGTAVEVQLLEGVL
ncbi:molybdopterin molybdotransferase MoeA [Usitatibacter palustris]|uniref:Molybdopterin molybdenumtransferase n=1 Tax=Usitatibacter palustris TaxID=2732487 RepID=A0A6M4H7K0_9PROT|nr:gephyrin-like molybdotransferase Glp [Usitatibacter palustris]QJR15586.1 Molybdopterin molybdenumtransferase [Usitatibacter palustris]